MTEKDFDRVPMPWRTRDAIGAAFMAAVMAALLMPETWVLLADLVQMLVPGIVVVAGL